MDTLTVTGPVCHRNPCQVDTCTERAVAWVNIPEPGMHMPPADLMACEIHAFELRRDCNAELFAEVH